MKMVADAYLIGLMNRRHEIDVMIRKERIMTVNKTVVNKTVDREVKDALEMIRVKMSYRDKTQLKTVLENQVDDLLDFLEARLNVDYEEDKL
jgi:hypothetical protein